MYNDDPEIHPNPHDAVFRQFLHEKETPQDFFEIWLPDEIKALCDFTTMDESGVGVFCR
ncbi:Rpn family recombination-promoting nuclease/putative transposase [Candidatus Williamhamiltonella defendens]|uniref:Rpn family recombination-promoting nuclease/putative transposase n=1 Tax=Candidatus Williamhamiltonella defendens TaxID=138072 RepID=UPI00228559FD|nr:Rpn family recombination-promoting nuclease/putative transposase [Candidatus Hamiltonella defensa]